MLWQPINLTEVCPANTQLTACSNFGYVYLSLLVHLFGDSEDRRIQQKLHIQEETFEKEEYDFIVVGAGAAGCVIANRLSAVKHWKVLLLEAGGEQPDVTLVPGLSTSLIGSSIDWSYKTEPNGKSCLARREQRCGWPRGKVMGGSSSINSMVYIRGNRLDYDGWAALGNEGWSYEEVLPYFRKSEDNLDLEGLNCKYHGVGGEQPVSRYLYIDKPNIIMTQAFNQGGLPILDYNGPEQVGAMPAQAVTKDGIRVSTNKAFIQPIRYKRKNLTVKVKAEVFGILINDDNVAYGVNYLKNGKVYTAFAKKEVIVSAGTINSPKLLMLSGIGPKEHLLELNITVKQDLPVGENLQDHVTFNGLIVALPNQTATLIAQDEILDEIKCYANMKVKRGPMSADGPANNIAFIKTEPDLPAPDVQFHIGHLYLDDYVREPQIADELMIVPTPYYDTLLVRAMNLVPKSRGKLLLNPADPYGKPLLYANYLDDPTDVIPILKAVKFAISLENTTAFISNGARYDRTPLAGCTDYEWGTDEYFLCLARLYTSATHHQAGTCKMGPHWDPKAVVDPKLRVYGVPGLRVIDASIMPLVVRGNTNAPSIMIGEKGVAMVLEYWLNKSHG
ncbi:unnamed protein product [Chrysodeixis includens]|uniref:Glucose-methanol-choline oxidoreductase N-terminal domain-containing protein n=1 Tax=Chrysodeixis includens TaxID=689277 RepID=A0A9P0C0L0_CHRIL|nr:unnamed protein product [Chrysodeixis includens]